MTALTTGDLAPAIARLPDLLKRDVTHKLTVETWNDQPVTSTVGKELLETRRLRARLSGDDTLRGLAKVTYMIIGA